jgi:hypothetical protein
MLTDEGNLWRGFIIRCLLALMLILILSLPLLQNLLR